MKTVAFTTLCCRVNQYDTDAMRGLFLQNGYETVDFDDKADIYVINTCSVTNMGERKSRQLIRKAKRTNENAYIIVTGCYAQLAPDAIAAIEGVNLVIGTNNRHRIVELVEQLDSTEKQISVVRNIMEQSTFEEMPLYGNEIDKVRAFMKIQEGCNNYQQGHRVAEDFFGRFFIALAQKYGSTRRTAGAPSTARTFSR